MFTLYRARTFDFPGETRPLLRSSLARLGTFRPLDRLFSGRISEHYHPVLDWFPDTSGQPITPFCLVNNILHLFYAFT